MYLITYLSIHMYVYMYVYTKWNCICMVFSSILEMCQTKDLGAAKGVCNLTMAMEHPPMRRSVLYPYPVELKLSHTMAYPRVFHLPARL